VPISQLISRGLRNAPVEKIRSACRPMAATKSSAAQWDLPAMWRRVGVAAATLAAGAIAAFAAARGGR